MAERSVPIVQKPKTAKPAPSKPHRTDLDTWRELFPRLKPAKPWPTPGGFTYSTERLPAGSWWSAKDCNGHDSRIFVAARDVPGATKSREYLRNIVIQYKRDGFRFMYSPAAVLLDLRTGFVNPEDE